MTFATAALLLLAFSIATARAETATVPKRSAYPDLQDNPLTRTKPGVAATDREKLEKLKEELNKARDRQSPSKTNDRAAGANAKKPEISPPSPAPHYVPGGPIERDTRQPHEQLKGRR
jgi:hypothetical protein